MSVLPCTLEGLKENVIVGRLIPAGTGAYLRGLQRLAGIRDDALTASREAERDVAIEAFPAELESSAVEAGAPAE